MMPSDSCLKDAWLQDSVMTGADLESADLRQAILSGADLRAAVLTSANPPRRASDFRSPDGALSLAPTGRAYSRRASTATEWRAEFRQQWTDSGGQLTRDQENRVRL